MHMHLGDFSAKPSLKRKRKWAFYKQMLKKMTKPFTSETTDNFALLLGKVVNLYGQL